MLEQEFLAARENEFVRIAPPRRMFAIAAFANTLPQLQAVLGLTLPAAPLCVCSGGVRFLWAGPATWLAIGDDPPVHARIAQAGAENLAAVTAQGDGRTVFLITGPFAEQILAKLVPIDLHPSVFAPLATAITLAGQIGIQIWRQDDGFALACLRSFGDSLAHALLAASREFTP